MALFQDSPLAFLLSTAVLLITTSSFLALSISLHSAYLWLAVVFVALIFLATFTCTYSLPGYFIQEAPQDANATPSVIDSTADLSRQNEGNNAYWIAVDLPPSYEVAVGALPPSYSKATSAMVKLDLKEAPVYSEAEFYTEAVTTN
ncbi:uncharacterized protein LOC124372858 [Homalodisca vitripennis]|uniref:uncharacterized protein LOC124372858 n=1 Tax=Homalodisca vitripennis TaxID=197043 RepID=UPI001EEB444D|nr:uncharacterized protein LOC124372858 [Homalodisca vitripennis]KAG8276078.1 hypothetical protein J6590_072867 [Homalodisca vitripennis]